MSCGFAVPFMTFNPCLGVVQFSDSWYIYNGFNNKFVIICVIPFLRWLSYVAWFQCFSVSNVQMCS